MVNCNRPAYEALWRSLPARERDSDWLTRWYGLRIGLRTRAFLPEPAGTSPVPFDTAIDGDRRPARRDQLAEQEVLAVFRQRFERWWQAGTREHLTSLAQSLEHSTARAGLGRRIARLGIFFGVDSDRVGNLPVALIGADRRFSGATHGEFRNEAIYVETLTGERADARTPTIAHELAHLVYSRAPREQRERIRTWFVEHESPLALPAYALFNEAVATAFGNGLVERTLLGEARFRQLLALPESLYADVYIDAAGRSAMPLVAEYLAAEQPIDRAFVDRYIDALGAVLGTRLTDQAFWLRIMVLATSSSSLWSLGDVVAERVRTGSLLQDDISQGCAENCLLRRYPEVAGIVAITNDKLHTLAGIVDESDLARIRRLGVVNGRAAYAVRRSDRSLLFIAAGDDDDSVAAALDELLDFGLIFEGPLP